MDVAHQGRQQIPEREAEYDYSFGLDDQDFVVAFETDEPKDFLDLVMELRETQSSKFTQRDTPIFTCVQMPVDSVLINCSDKPALCRHDLPSSPMLT